MKLPTYPGGLKIQRAIPQPSEDNLSLLSRFHNFSELWLAHVQAAFTFMRALKLNERTLLGLDLKHVIKLK